MLNSGLITCADCEAKKDRHRVDELSLTLVQATFRIVIHTCTVIGASDMRSARADRLL